MYSKAKKNGKWLQKSLDFVFDEFSIDVKTLDEYLLKYYDRQALMKYYYGLNPDNCVYNKKVVDLRTLLEHYLIKVTMKYCSDPKVDNNVDIENVDIENVDIENVDIEDADV